MLFDCVLHGCVRVLSANGQFWAWLTSLVHSCAYKMMLGCILDTVMSAQYCAQYSLLNTYTRTSQTILVMTYDSEYVCVNILNYDESTGVCAHSKFLCVILGIFAM